MKRRLDRLEGSLSPRAAVLRWMGEAHAFGSLPAYVASLVDQPASVQPFVAIPRQVQEAVYTSMRGAPRSAIKTAMDEAVADTIFRLRLVLDLNVHVDDVLRVERLRQVALAWWSRALEAEGAKDKAARTKWQRGVATLRGTLHGTERARAAAEAEYLDGHDCLFPELAMMWSDLSTSAESLVESQVPADDAAASEADWSVRRVLLMARADGLGVAGQHVASDAVAERVGRHLVAKTTGNDG